MHTYLNQATPNRTTATDEKCFVFRLREQLLNDCNTACCPRPPPPPFNPFAMVVCSPRQLCFTRGVHHKDAGQRGATPVSLESLMSAEDLLCKDESIARRRLSRRFAVSLANAAHAMPALQPRPGKAGKAGTRDTRVLHLVLPIGADDSDDDFSPRRRRLAAEPPPHLRQLRLDAAQRLRASQRHSVDDLRAALRAVLRCEAQSRDPPYTLRAVYPPTSVASAMVASYLYSHLRRACYRVEALYKFQLSTPEENTTEAPNLLSVYAVRYHKLSFKRGIPHMVLRKNTLLVTVP